MKNVYYICIKTNEMLTCLFTMYSPTCAEDLLLKKIILIFPSDIFKETILPVNNDPSNLNDHVLVFLGMLFEDRF